jgi:hypothetical protein
LPGSLLGAFCLFGVPALGEEISIDGPMVSKLNVPLDNDMMLAVFGKPPVVSSPKQMRPLSLYEDLLGRLTPRGVLPQVHRSPVPSVQAICTSLEVILPNFDLASDQLPDRLRKRLCRRVRKYAVGDRRSVQAMLYRADNYLPMIKHTLRERELPTYYAYVPLVESAFQVEAMHGGSGARGLWQLMRTTARTRGLTVSKAFDERLHPRRSTEAAVDYLVHLYHRFGDYGPLYVLAAYNYGETNLSRKMRRFRSAAVASLYRPGYLPDETREYLLRMMTMWVITAHPRRFHFLLREAADLSLSPLDAVPREDVSVSVAESDDTKR